MDLTDVYRVLHLESAQHTFSAANRTFSKIDHILGNEASLNKSKNIEITLCILTDHSAVKLELNNTKSIRKNTIGG
jgi:endonuclease/exonuclease/phosphatase family metal-dependent hydrolase